ncbi:MAG: hypothetical protein LBO09_07170 [Candidatus Peribacteria bacterium]|jgi:REP element-mobilizing transposase RayT|nr:hypothetical protein [Candidatus Peribacteria bacterium]
MVLSKIGHICDEEIQIMLEKRPSVDIHEYVIMPNHIHILLGMEGSDQSNDTKITNQTLGSIICGLKSAITKHCHEQGYVFARQSRYHDHIVRDEQAYDNIKFYIQQNPKKWKEDKFWVEI